MSSTTTYPLDTTRTGLVYPKPGAECAAALPQETVRVFAWGEWREADPEQGYWICSIIQDDGTAESPYPNNEFTPFYEVTGDALADDPRAIAIRQVLGEDTQVVLAAKTKPVKLLGVLTEDAAIETREGAVEAAAGSYLVESPDNPGQVWPVAKAVFEKRYAL